MSDWRKISTLAKQKDVTRVEFTDESKTRRWQSHFPEGKPHPVNDEVSRIDAAFWRPVEAE